MRGSSCSSHLGRSRASRVSCSRTRRRAVVRVLDAELPVDDAGDVVDVAIVGAGPGGFATALAFSPPVSTFASSSSARSSRPAGVAIFIWPHGLNALKSIDAATCDRVVSSGAVTPGAISPSSSSSPARPRRRSSSRSTSRDGVDAWTLPQIGITWARLTNALREGLALGTVRLGHRL